MSPGNNLALHALLHRAALRPAGWFAFSYLGYWLALALDRILVQAVVCPLWGMQVTEWSVTAFRLRIANAIPGDYTGSLSLPVSLPLVLELIFLIVLARWGARLGSAFLRISLHFAGLWVVLLLGTQGATLAYWGALRMGQFNLRLSVLGLARTAPRIALTAGVAALVVAFGQMCARRLAAELRSSILPPEGWSWLIFPFLTGPVLLILAGSFGFTAHFFGLHARLNLLVPAGLCLLLGLIGLLGPCRSALAAGRGARVSSSAALSALCVSGALYAGLQQAPHIQTWLSERHFWSVSSAHYKILFAPRSHAAESVRALAEQRERLLATMAGRLETPPEKVRLRVVLYPDLASLRAATGSERAYRVDGATIRAVLGGYIVQVDPAADAAALLNTAWGRPGSTHVGEWVARWLAGQCCDRDIAQWAAQIESEVGHYTLAQLADSSSDSFLSPLVRQPLGAAWVGTIFDRKGLAAVHQLYTAKSADLPALATRLGVAPAQLEQDWQQWTAEMVSRAATDPPAQRLPDAGTFFRGISFSHEGWGGRSGGYTSPEAAAQLRRLTALGANAIAVVPYGFARGAQEGAISYTGTDETDEELTQALHAAHSLGMKVMLKPQLWVGRGDFTGAIRFDDPSVRAAWMRHYREFILHYARLAELEQFDLLSVGTELEGLTAYPDDWRRLIAEVRRVYHGPITYAANWGHEFESLRFWDVLDYASVNNYYPLRSAPPAGSAAGGAPPRAEDLLPGAQRLAERLEAVSRKWHKPILFTEVGYPSVRGGASEPWIEDASRGINLEEQAAAYEATFRAFSGRPWFRGMFWWKWPSSGRGGGPRDTSYTPLGKPAEEVVRAWFTRLASASKRASTQTP